MLYLCAEIYIIKILRSRTFVRQSPSCPPPACKEEEEEGPDGRRNDRKMAETACHDEVFVNKQKHP